MTPQFSNGPEFEEVGIDENQITDAGAETLACALQHSVSVRHLYIGENKISSTGEQKLRAAKPAGVSLHFQR